MTGKRTPSLLTRIIHAGADSFVRSAPIPAESREALRATFVSVMEAQFSAFRGGEQVRVFVPATPKHLVVERRARIVTALRRGDPAADIARRERVSVRWVRRIKRELPEQNPPEQFPTDAAASEPGPEHKG